MMIIPSPRYTTLDSRIRAIREESRKYYARWVLKALFIVFLTINYLGFDTIRHREALNAQRHQPCTAKTRCRRTNKCDDPAASDLPLIARVAKLFEPQDSDFDKETEGMDEPQV